MPAVIQPKSKYAPFADCPAPMREFLTYILTIKNLSVRTVDGYYIEIRTFLRFMKLFREKKESKSLSMEMLRETVINDIPNELIFTVTLSDVYEYLTFALSSGNSASARARKISALSSFYKYLTTKTMYMTDNPIKNLDRPSPKRALPKFLTLEESNELLITADLTDNARDYCIITLFLNCGMRLSELLAINISDVDRLDDNRSLRLLGKGNKERIVYLNDACVSSIEEYLKASKDIRRKDKKALFVGRNGTRLSSRRVEQIINDCLKRAGLSGKGYTPHKLRHTAATLMYQYGNVDVRILKEILGHASLATTEIYTHVSSTQLENAANSSPLSSTKRAPKKDAKDEI